MDDFSVKLAHADRQHDMIWPYVRTPISICMRLNMLSLARKNSLPIYVEYWIYVATFEMKKWKIMLKKHMVP